MTALDVVPTPDFKFARYASSGVLPILYILPPYFMAQEEVDSSSKRVNPGAYDIYCNSGRAVW